MMKKVMEILKKWFGKTSVSMMKETPSEDGSHSPEPSREERKNRKRTMLDDLEAFLFDRYDFRFNVLTEQTEYRCKDEEAFQQVDQRVLNTLCIDARGQGILVPTIDALTTGIDATCVEHALHRCPWSRHQLLGQGCEPIAPFTEDTGFSPFPLLYGFAP